FLLRSRDLRTGWVVEGEGGESASIGRWEKDSGSTRRGMAQDRQLQAPPLRPAGGRTATRGGFSAAAPRARGRGAGRGARRPPVRLRFWVCVSLLTALAAIAALEFRVPAPSAALERAAELVNRAQIYTAHGEYQQALDLFGGALEIYRDTGREAEEAVSL